MSVCLDNGKIINDETELHQTVLRSALHKLYILIPNITYHYCEK